jgi:hypothetical protein
MSDSLRRHLDGPDERPPDRDLHERLLALSDAIAFPETPDIAASVRHALDRERPSPRTRPAFSWLPRPIAFAAAAALLVVAAALLIPATRDTVAGWLGVPGIEIQFRDDEPAPTVAATPAQNLGLLLGEPVTIEEARQLVDIDIAVPNAPGPGMPDEIYVRLRPGADQVVFLYGARPGFPAAAETGIGLLLIQFEAPDDDFWAVKQISGSNDVRPVPINGKDGLWIGGSHLLMMAPNPDPVTALQPTPDPGTPTARPSANVLLWADHGITYRIESALSRQESIILAESMVPLDPATPTP